MTLKNGSFKGGTSHSECIYWAPEGGPFMGVFPENDIPDGWIGWFVRDKVNSGSPPDQKTGKPEMKVIRLSAGFPDPVRVREGDAAFQMFCNWRTIKAGLMQQIEVPVGKLVRVTAYAHAWYSQCSTRPHDPPLKADCRTPALDSQLWLRVGISPTGSLDPLWAGDFQWSETDTVNGMEQYGGYRDTPMVVEAVAESETVTVGLRANCNYTAKHVDTYWDSVAVEILEPPPPPRLYERTAVLYGPATTRERAHQLLDEHWEQRRSFLFSADDAMAGNEFVTSRTVLAYDGESWPDGKNGLVQFRDTFYPGTDLQFVDDVPNPNPPPSGVPWSADISGELAHNPGPYENDWLILTSGWWKRRLDQIDGLTVHHTAGSTNPYAVAENHILRDGGTPSIHYHLWIEPDGNVLKVAPFENAVWHDNTGHYSKHLGVVLAGDMRVAELPEAMMDALVRVVAWTVRNSDMRITFETVKGHLDYSSTACPGWQNGWKDAFYAALRAELDIEPEPEPEPPPVFNPRVLTLHLQQDVEAGQRFVSTCKPAAIKRVQGAQNLPTYAAINPGMRCIYRGMGESEDPVTFVNMHIDTLHQVADMFEERGLPLIDGHYFWWELWNEVYGYDREPNIMWRDREIAATLELARREPRVGVVAFNAGVGNIRVENFDVLVPLARVVEENYGMMGLHSYFGATPDSCSIDNYEGEGRWLESRWEMTDDYLLAHGVRVNWFLSEGGAIYYQPPTNMPYSSDGWKNANCMGGDWSRYLAKLEQLARHYYQQNLKRGGRLKGYAIFTQGGWNTWQMFELGSAEVDAIAAMQARIWPVTAG